jgi:hypothetical protein
LPPASEASGAESRYRERRKPTSFVRGEAEAPPCQALTRLGKNLEQPSEPTRKIQQIAARRPASCPPILVVPSDLEEVVRLGASTLREAEEIRGARSAALADHMR